MDPIPSYNLLQAIDPTKIKLPISDRFAKLTLSSNKKKQQQQNDPEKQQEQQRQHDKRDSVSRDISKQFVEDDKENAEKSQNPLLRSESSKDTGTCNKSDTEDEEEELTMDPLQVSQDYDNPTQVAPEMDLLSQQIASLEVKSNPVSLSSGSTCDLSEHSQLVSTESQRSSSSGANNIHIVHHIPINVKEALEETIALNLTSSTNKQLEKTCEMTDDDDDDEEEDETADAITISDTSESQHDQPEQDIMATSSLPSNSTTSELILPSLTDDKAERVAAFLRDVSLERHAMAQHGHLVLNDTVDQILDNKEIDKIQETLAKSRQIATADTESMTPDGEEESITKSQLEREKRLKALESESLEELSSNHDNLEFLTESDKETSPKKFNKSENIHRLANAETQENTVMSQLQEEIDGDKTLKVVTNRKPRFATDSPKTNQANNVYRMANDETQCNTEFSLNEDENETPKTHNTKYNSRRLANLETEDNTALYLTQQQMTDNNHKETDDARRLINDDTMPNSIITGDLGQQSLVYNYTQDYKTPEKRAATDRNNSSISQHSTPRISNESGHKEDSFAIIINSSPEVNDSQPEHSITISETDDESFEQKSAATTASSPKSKNSDDKKLSNSFRKEVSTTDDSDVYDDEQMSQIQMSMANINISAKISIKIHIPSSETSEDDQNYEESERKSLESNPQQNPQTENNNEENPMRSSNDQTEESENEHNIESNNQSTESDVYENPCKQKQLKATTPQDDDEEVIDSPNKSSDSVEVVENKIVLTAAEQKLLNQLYGKSWQTPDVIRTRKRNSQNGDKKLNNTKTSTSSRKKNDVKSSKEKNSNHKAAVEESILDDFSIFRRNIVKTNLDSTRLATPKTNAATTITVSTEPRNTKKPLTQKETTASKPQLPQTERKVFRPPVAKVVVNKGRVDNGRWRQLIDEDSDSEGDNASDDDDADESWSKNASEIERDNSDSDFDFENSPRPRARNNKKNNTTNKGRSNKSDILMKKLNKSKEGEVVYLDLSKDEVEVQDEVPESPPANHDVTFATRLQDILKTCRHEDKAKIPSSTKKTKRKLFTPNFGDDEYEAAALTKEDEKTKTKENTSATININNNEEEHLDDTGYCPFDSRGRPKVFDLVNKQLESVKTSKPIFQLTPSPKKKVSTSSSSTKADKNTKTSGGTPKTKTSNEAATFKTPLTVKSKNPAKTLQELCPTPNYKYSFLKSLDVTVSKTLCHPDALYYRENYRTKKEDLSKILYDMYNEKLFKNQLNVPITWNKKLSNTAGRCLNKKKMGVRSSVIELSDKVLTSADRLRCTLIHELCHASTWIFNGEGGHGSTWKEWARRANATFPEIPKIGVCHQYDIEYKYTYKCTLCAAKSHAHSKSKKVENIRCSYCHGAIEIFLNKKDKDGNIMPTPVKEPTGFAKFVKDNYKKFKREDLKHADVMKLLSSEFASLKVANN